MYDNNTYLSNDCSIAQFMIWEHQIKP